MKTATETAVTATTIKKEQNINLIEGIFTASETADLLRAMLDQKINFHKVHRLGITEGNHNDACTYDNNRINELIAEKEKLNAFIKQVRESGGALQINGTVEIKLLK